MRRGGTWNGEYMVVDLTDIVGQSLAMDADGYDYRAMPYITKQARLGDAIITFSFKARYDHQNLSIGGVDPLIDPLSATAAANTNGGDLPLLDEASLETAVRAMPEPQHTPGEAAKEYGYRWTLRAGVIPWMHMV